MPREGAPSFAPIPEMPPEPERRGGVRVDDRLRTLEDIEAQRRWQTEGSFVERHARFVFDALAQERASGAEPSAVSAIGLPLTDALLAACAATVRDPSFVPDDATIRSFVDRLRTVAREGHAPADALALMCDPTMSAALRLQWFDRDVAGLLRYTAAKDLRALRETPPPTEAQSDQSVAPPAQDRMRTSMDELEKMREGEQPVGYATIHSFYGGYYPEQVFDRHDGGSAWSRRPCAVADAPTTEGLREERVEKITIRGGAVTPLAVPSPCTADGASLRASGNARVRLTMDAHGDYALDARGAPGEIIACAVSFGIPERGVRRSSGVPPTEHCVTQPFISVEAHAFLATISGSVKEKGRAIQRFVRSRLTYSNDSSLNAVYESDAEGYFAAVEREKKADCDVANAYFLNLCAAAGIMGTMPTGHYVKKTDANGAAVLHSGSRHAWSRLWDADNRQWLRFDATPPGDPTMDDDERPEGESEEEEQGPGDYGEQDAFAIPEEELERRRAEIAEKMERAKERDPDAARAAQLAKETGCTSEEARRVLARIDGARRITDDRGRPIRSVVAQEFKSIAAATTVARRESRGPVPWSQGDEVDDKPMIGRDLQKPQARKDPMGFARERTRERRTIAVGGFGLVLVLDRSGSMNDIDGTTQRPKKDEQQEMAFLLEDGVASLGHALRIARQSPGVLAPLDVVHGAVAFQGKSAEWVKPLSTTWERREQVELWRGLESNVGRGTPAHLGLSAARAAIERAIAEDAAQGNAPRVWMVAVFTDGEVDVNGRDAYVREHAALTQIGADVSVWGMTESAQGVEALPNGTCVPSVRACIEPVVARLIARAQALWPKEKKK